MNKNMLFSCLLLMVLILWCTASRAQEAPYYYYNGKKEYLRLDKTKLNVTATADFQKAVTKDSGIRNEFGQLGTPSVVQGVVFGDIRFNAVPSDAEYNQRVLSLKRNTEVIMVQPCFLTSENDSVGMSSYLYVKLKDTTDYLVLEQFAAQKKVLIVEKNQFMPLWYTLQCTGETTDHALSIANSFYESGLFAAAAPDFLSAKLHCCNDPDFQYQWGLNNATYPGADVNACAAWEIAQGKGVKVAIVDFGVDLDHVDLAENISSLSYDAESGTTPSCVYYSLSHGTCIAGIIGAVKDNGTHVAGVAPKCALMSISYPFPVYSPSGLSPLEASRLANGINWAWQNGADIINNSWGLSTMNEMLNEAFINALTYGRNGKGTVIVFSSGNDGKNAIPYPGKSIPNALIVGSIDSDGTRSSFSNYGDALDLVAPGNHILSTMLNGTVSYSTGTSMAAPYVAGAAALVLSRNPYLTGQEVRSILEKTAQRIGAGTHYVYSTVAGRPNGRWNNSMGYGLVDAYAAVQVACTDTDFIENENVSGVQTVEGCNIYTRNITVVPNSKLTLDAREITLIHGEFKVKVGAELQIK